MAGIINEDRKEARSMLVSTVNNLLERLVTAQQVLQDFDNQPESNTYDDYQKACYSVEGKLEYKASDACEGSHCYGLDHYEQEFIVNGVHYLGELSVQYNRHDKTYYYVDGTEFTVTEIK